MYNKIISLISKDILLILGYVLQELKTEVIGQQDCSLGKILVFKFDDLNLIPETHIIEKEK